MYRIRNFFYKIKRSCRWFIFMWTLLPFEEDFEFLKVMERYLLDMANHLQKCCEYGYISNDVKWIRLTAKLIRMDINDYYIDKTTSISHFGGKQIKKAYEQQNKLRRLIFKILEEKLHSWWI